MMVGATTSLTSCQMPVRTNRTVGLLVPAYFDPNSSVTDWHELQLAALEVPLIVVINPDSGPGGSESPSYSEEVRTMERAGARVLGYVHTSGGTRRASVVEAEIEHYFSWYHVDGIFIDEMASQATAATLGYYRGIRNFIEGLDRKALTVANPGTAFSSAFAHARTANIYVDEEDTAINVASYHQAGWELTAVPSTFAEIAVAATNDASEISTLGSRNVSWIYSTTLSANPNPYEALPSDFSEEVAAVAELNRTYRNG